MSETRRALLTLLILLAATAWLTACRTGPMGPPVTRNGDRIAGREFLLPGQRESTAPEPYALYSYLLFGAAPSPEARPTYLEVIRSYLDMLPPIQRLERDGARRRELNVTYLPVEDPRAVAAVLAADPEAPALLLRHYNYSAARILLAKVPGGPHLNGPYLVSFRQPLGQVERLSSMWVDPDAIRHAIKKCGFDPSGCDYRIIATTKPGRPYVSGWGPATLLSTDGLARHSVGTTIAANSLAAGTAYWRKL